MQDTTLTETSKTSSLKIEDPCLVCGVESDYGAHGIRNGEVYDEYFCEKHYHSKKKETVEEPNEATIDRGSASEDIEVRPSLPVPAVDQPVDLAAVA